MASDVRRCAASGAAGLAGQTKALDEKRRPSTWIGAGAGIPIVAQPASSRLATAIRKKFLLSNIVAGQDTISRELTWALTLRRSRRA
jgi:hypothetical protein